MSKKTKSHMELHGDQRTRRKEEERGGSPAGRARVHLHPGREI